MTKKPVPDNYDNFLRSLKERIRTAQVRAALAVNRELVLLYWQIGKEILELKMFPFEEGLCAEPASAPCKPRWLRRSSYRLVVINVLIVLQPCLRFLQQNPQNSLFLNNASWSCLPRLL